MSFEISSTILGAAFAPNTPPSVVTVPVPVSERVAAPPAAPDLRTDMGGSQHRPPPSRANSEALFQSLFLELSTDPDVQKEGPDYAKALYTEMKALLAIDPK